MSEQEPTNTEILQAINDFATATEQRFQGMDDRFQEMDDRFQGIEKDMVVIKATMVTRDYLDDKLADLKGDLVVLMRKEDAKLTALIEMLSKKNIISADEVKTILSMQPFPQLYAWHNY